MQILFILNLVVYKLQAISTKSSYPSNISIYFINVLRIFFSFWLKNLVCKLFVLIWRYQLISRSPLSETDLYKPRSKLIFWLSTKCSHLFYYSYPLILTIISTTMNKWFLDNTLHYLHFFLFLVKSAEVIAKKIWIFKNQSYSFSFSFYKTFFLLNTKFLSLILLFFNYINLLTTNSLII